MTRPGVELHRIDLILLVALDALLARGVVDDCLENSVLWHERYQHDPGHRWLRNEIVAAAGTGQQAGLEIPPNSDGS